ncbi:MAG TPA: hypothetical protein VK913_12030 [Erythrobacter sp.]|nr:hypothetical protein [Erythrobacter sp.]
MIRFALATSVALASAFTAAAKEGAGNELPVGSLSVRPDTVRNTPTVEIDIILVIEPGNVRHHRMDRRLIDRQGNTVRSSADSRACPAMMAELAKVEELPMPRFAAPGTKSSAVVAILMHPTNYTLAMRGYESRSNTGARIELNAQSGSPLAQWTDATLEALEPCWDESGV